MKNEAFKFFPIGENALTIDFGNFISRDLNNFVLALDKYIQENNFEGFIESVPAYSSLTVFYDFLKVKQRFSNFPTTFAAVADWMENALKNLPEILTTENPLIEIPVCFDEEFAPDLEFIAETHKLEKSRVIEIFTSQTYRVYMLGFLPGFAYMGEVDGKIATPRKTSPRLKVPKGSVGIAGKQTGIYPFESPGGWQIIGKTDVELFTPNSDSPTFLQAGDTVKFVAVK